MVAIHPTARYKPRDEGMLTVTEVAHLLGAHANSVRRWADLGLLPSYRIGQRGDRRFRSEEISGFLFSQRRG